MLSQTFLWGNVIVDFPESLKGQALARLLANWAPFVRRPAIINFRGTIAWEQRMAYDAAARRCEDELMEHGFQGHITLYTTGAMVMHAVARWNEDAYMSVVSSLFSDGNVARGLILEKAVEDHFQYLLKEELARPIEYTPKAE